MRTTWTLLAAAASLAGASAASAQVQVWQQGFESNAIGWLDDDTNWAGTVAVVSSGTNGIVSSEGSSHAIFTQGVNQPNTGDMIPTGPFSRFDGYRSVWPDGMTASVDVYLDTNWAAGEGFDYSVAATGTDGAHQRDFIFHVAKDTSTGQLLVGADNNTNFNPREDLDTLANHYVVPASGWYTFEHVFYDNGDGILSVDLKLLDSNGNEVFSETRHAPADVIATEVGGNRYAWFTNIDIASGIAVDAQSLTVGHSIPTVADADPSYLDNGDMIGRSGLDAHGFLTDGGTNSAGEPVAVYLRARNRDGVTASTRSGNVFYVHEMASSNDQPQFDFQFTPAPSDSDTAGVTNYYLRLAVDIDSSAGVNFMDITNPIFDADGFATNSWDDIETGVDGRGDGLYVTDAASSDPGLSPGAFDTWNRDDIAYVYSQSWRHEFGFIVPGPIGPGDYTIVWEVYEGDPGAGGTRLAGVEGVMRVLPAGDSPISTVALTDAGDGCVNASEQLVVNVDAQLIDDVYGGQFFMSYDTAALDVASIVPGPGLDEMYSAFDDGAGTIDYAVNRPASAPTALSGDATLATITFNVADSVCSPTADLVSFRPTSFPTPPTQLTGAGAQAVALETSNLGPVSLDIEPPTFTVPSDVTVNADAGLCTAAIDGSNFLVTDAADNCTTPTVTSERSDSLALADPFPTGPTIITWTATDGCGNSTVQFQTVTVNAVNDLHVDVALDGVSNDVQRCITFKVGGVEYTALVDFTAGNGSADIEVACGNYDCITARDALHTLRTTSAISLSGTGYTASFTGADALVSGNLNGDVYIDILDFGGYAGQFADSVPVDTDCSTTPIHADFSGDGVVFTEDFTFISTNFLAVSELNCEGGTGATQPPVERISVQELRLRGDDALARGDMNHDGWLDQGDLSAFILTGGEPCTADFNASGAVDVFDLLTYLDLWFTADPAANLAGNASVDVFDLLAFLDSWFAGCP